MSTEAIAQAILQLAGAIRELASTVAIPPVRGRGRPPNGSGPAVIAQVRRTVAEERELRTGEILGVQDPFSSDHDLPTDGTDGISGVQVEDGGGVEILGLPTGEESGEPPTAPVTVVTVKTTADDLKTALTRLMQCSPEHREQRKALGVTILNQVGANRLSEVNESRYKELMGLLLDAIKSVQGEA